MSWLEDPLPPRLHLRHAAYAAIWILLFASVIIICVPPAWSQLSIFQTEAMAQLHCPNDLVVWLDFPKRRYYTRDQKLYGKGRTGVFVCREEARKNHHRPSLFGRR
jgi:hypothetical protein